MAISLEYEFENAGDLLSPYMRPVLYFKVSGAGSVTDPTAEIEFAGSSETVTFDAIFIQTVSTEHYFAVDLADIMPHLMSKFDSGSYPDDIEFINGDRLQMFDEYFRSLEIDVYFERGTADEQTLTQANYWAHLSAQLPKSNGFHISDVEGMSCLLPLKWVKNTYNALFFWHAGGWLKITKATTSIVNNITSWTNVDYTTFTSADESISSAVCSASGKYCKSNTLSVISGDAVLIYCVLTLNSGAAPTIELRRVDTNAVVSNQEALSSGANSKTLTATYTGNVYLSVTSTAACDFSLGTVYINYPVGFYQLKFSKTTTKIATGLNTIAFENDTYTKSIIIDYDQTCTTNVFHLCWQHPSLGYVSFPFRGNKVTNITAKKRNEFDKFFYTLQNVNALKEITGYDETRRVTLTTKADAQYWPLLEYLYSSRHVYLYVGADGDADSSLTWLECEVSGSASYRSDRIRGTFTVDLLLPETLNVRL